MGKKTPAPFFFGKDDKLPIMLSLFLGFQHAIAMLGGIATSGGYLIANDACLPWQRDSEMCGRKAWLISTAWLACGLLSIVQIFRLKCGGYSLGTGLISMMGTSFTFLPIARTMTISAISDAKATTCADNNGTAVFTGECCFGGDCKGAGAIGYGKFLGTCLVAALVECIIAMLPPRIIKKLFPPVVTGACVMLIGGGLLTSGMKYLGGGVFCAENTESRSTTFGGPQLCAGDNGDVVRAQTREPAQRGLSRPTTGSAPRPPAAPPPCRRDPMPARTGSALWLARVRRSRHVGHLRVHPHSDIRVRRAWRWRGSSHRLSSAGLPAARGLPLDALIVVCPPHAARPSSSLPSSSGQ
jgi:hypothetical protein